MQEKTNAKRSFPSTARHWPIALVSLVLSLGILSQGLASEISIAPETQAHHTQHAPSPTHVYTSTESVVATVRLLHAASSPIASGRSEDEISHSGSSAGISRSSFLAQSAQSSASPPIQWSSNQPISPFLALNASPQQKDTKKSHKRSWLYVLGGAVLVGSLLALANDDDSSSSSQNANPIPGTDTCQGNTCSIVFVLPQPE